MAALIYGPAIAVSRGEGVTEGDFVTSIYLRMIRLYISDFNITPADDFALIVFRRPEDCTAACRSYGVNTEADQVRYFPKRTLM